ncbi:MAG: hypothetical protein IRZ21_04565 [Thermoleophilaceae bacterium]|nr:hypothetical protein [Thermoleophilaceae bacterium]
MLRILRNLDLIVLALALAVFVAAGLPLAGWAAGAAVWVAQRAVKELMERKALASSEARTTVGLVAGSMILRGWLVALTIFGVGLADKDSGLAAAVLFLAVFTVQFSTSIILRPFEKNGGTSA